MTLLAAVSELDGAPKTVQMDRKQTKKMAVNFIIFGKEVLVFFSWRLLFGCSSEEGLGRCDAFQMFECSLYRELCNKAFKKLHFFIFIFLSQRLSLKSSF